MKQVFLYALLLGCGKDTHYVAANVYADCTVQDASRPALAEAIIACVKAGNPLSDEEGEDLVEQCHASMVSVLCKNEWFYVREGYDRVLCSRADAAGQKMCRDEGWVSESGSVAPTPPLD